MIQKQITKSIAKPIMMTGIKPTGNMHLGNYKGFIENIIKYKNDYQIFVMIADGHAVTYPQNALVQFNNIQHIAKALIACDLGDIVLYKQSDILELFQIYWLLCCFCNKGLINRSHAYKAAIMHEDQGSLGVGLYTYAILMAADILALEADIVPVGSDQKQHIEICNDLAQRVNHFTGQSVFKLPNPLIADCTLKGTDGRKMSKSYGNTLELFADENEMKKKIYKIATNSQMPDEPKEKEVLFELFEAVADKKAVLEMEKRYRVGVSWKEVKDELCEAILAFTRPKKTVYENLLDVDLSLCLNEGAKTVRLIAARVLKRLQKGLGLC